MTFTNPNATFTHEGQPQMQAEVILASRNAEQPQEPVLYTIRLRYPRIIHGEIMTHRVFSRNARSSRAVPVKTMLDEVRREPFVPWHWGKNQKGMQASEECNEWVSVTYSGLSEPVDALRNDAWVIASKRACGIADAFMEAGYHKQISNRLLEPFSWIDVLITSNDWANFLWLRDHKDAEPHLQDLARLLKKAIDSAKVQELKPGQWHLPYITEEDINEADLRSDDAFLRKISAARCARISYAPFNGDSSYKAELNRYDLLVTSDRVHASPLEHQATPDDSVIGPASSPLWVWKERHGNLSGWVQHRKLIDNEYYKG